MLIHKKRHYLERYFDLPFFRKICSPALLPAVDVPYRKTEVDVRKSKVNQEWCTLTLRITMDLAVVQFSFRQLCKSVNFRHEIYRVLIRSRIYYVLLFHFLLIRPAQIHSMHMFHTEKKHRNIQLVYSRLKIKKKHFLQWSKTVSGIIDCRFVVYQNCLLDPKVCFVHIYQHVFKAVIIFAFIMRYINNYFYFFFLYDLYIWHIIWFIFTYNIIWIDPEIIRFSLFYANFDNKYDPDFIFWFDIN